MPEIPCSQNDLALTNEEEELLSNFPVSALVEFIQAIPCSAANVKKDICATRQRRLDQQDQRSASWTECANRVTQLGLKGLLRSGLARYYRDLDRVTKICLSAPIQDALLQRHQASACTREDLMKTVHEAFRTSPEAGHEILRKLYKPLIPFFRDYLAENHTPLSEQAMEEAIRHEKWLEAHCNPDAD